MDTLLALLTELLLELNELLLALLAELVDWLLLLSLLVLLALLTELLLAELELTLLLLLLAELLLGELLEELLFSALWLLAELELTELDSLELELDKSSILKMERRSPVLGPGNCNDPVWKFSTSAALTSPVDLVSTKVACQISLSGNVWVDDSAVPARDAVTSAAGAVSSPARQ